MHIDDKNETNEFSDHNLITVGWKYKRKTNLNTKISCYIEINRKSEKSIQKYVNHIDENISSDENNIKLFDNIIK